MEQHCIHRILFAASLTLGLHPLPVQASSILPGVLAKSGGTHLVGLVNLNTATEQELTLLPGIGPTTARKIVAYRDAHPFRRLVHLMRVKGIGRKTYGELVPYLTLEGETTIKME